MNVASEKVGATWIMRLQENRLDAHNARAFKSKIVECVENGEDRIALDMSQVEFIDSSGLGAIVSSLKAMGGGRSLSIFGLNPPTMSMFKLTRMDRVLSLYANQDEALAGEEAA